VAPATTMVELFMNPDILSVIVYRVRAAVKPSPPFPSPSFDRDPSGIGIRACCLIPTGQAGRPIPQRVMANWMTCHLTPAPQRPCAGLSVQRIRAQLPSGSGPSTITLRRLGGQDKLPFSALQPGQLQRVVGGQESDSMRVFKAV